jgi:hypothetical protein
MKDLNWSRLLINFSYVQSTVSLGILVFVVVFFYRRKKALPTLVVAGSEVAVIEPVT